MNKCLFAILLLIGLASCTVKDEHYYRTHPKLVQTAIKECPGKQPAGISCQDLEVIAKRINELAYQLQYNPQGFGNTILKLQQDLAADKLALQKNKEDSALQAAIESKRRALDDHLAIVKWLESPES